MFYFSKFKTFVCLVLCSMFLLSGFWGENEPDFYMGKVRASASDLNTVYLGGNILGYDFNTDGVYVVSTSSVLTENGFLNTFSKKEIVAGDIVKKVNGQDVFSGKDIDAILQNDENECKTAKIEAIRKGKNFSVEIKPAYDVVAQKYKLGLWVKNSLSGVGTVTYIKKDGRFGALGHPIAISGTKDVLGVKSGNVYDCSVLGVKPASYGKTGEVLGAIARKNCFGTLDKNCEYGVFGNMSQRYMLENEQSEIPVANRREVKTGKAQIFCALNGKDVKAYDIEIIKTNYQSVSSDKSLVFKLVDKALINTTGGIVQGMSGSPIVQNGKLVGAVTHVFINDATKGFGVYIEWMLQN